MSDLEPRASPYPSVADHVRRYVETGGDDGARVGGMPCLLLTTRGRRSGLLIRTPLIFVQLDGDAVVVAAAAGASTHPQWYRNLADNGSLESSSAQTHSTAPSPS